MFENNCESTTSSRTKVFRSLAIVGPYPPPNGGVTMHVRRLCQLLAEHGVDYIVYNAGSRAEDGDRVVSVFPRRRTWLMRYAFMGKEPAVCFLTARPMAWFVGWFMATLRGKRVLVRLQNTQILDHWQRSPLQRAMAGFALRSMSAVVCVNRDLVAAVAGLGVEARRIHLFPGFLPPLPSECSRSAIAPAVWQFSADRHPLIVANGKVGWHKGVDLYGLDHLIELTANLKTNFPGVGTVVCFSDYKPEDQKYLDMLLARAEALGVAENILFNTEPGPFLPILAAADLFVRPTSTDGDANSIREALFLGVPTVASDVTERPGGVFLYRNRDIAHLAEMVRQALSTSLKSPAGGKPMLGRQDQERISAYANLLADLAEGKVVPR